MNIRFHEQLYSNGISKRRLASVCRRVKKRSPKLNLFLVTLPLGNQGILEVYWYPELLQSYYQQQPIEVFVVGLADTKKSAFELVEQIVADALQKDGRIRLDAVIRERT